MVLIAVRCPFCQSDQIIKAARLKPVSNATAASLPTVLAAPSYSTRLTKGAYPRSKSKWLT